MPDRLTTVFLDRDGVINVKAPAGEYVESWEQFAWLPGAVDAVRALRDAGLRVVVVTNQRGVALGRMSAESVEDIHERIAESVPVDRIYYCPHQDGECDCRKPGVGMFERAAREVPGVTLGRSAAIVGDSESDMQAGRALGLVLVKVGSADSEVDHVCASLAEAAEWLVGKVSDVPAEPDDHREELLRLLRGAPQRPLGSMARELGVTEAEARGLIEELLDKGRVTREGDRLVVVEPAAAPYEPGEEPV
jgi:D-glycero-D-manno-heptose 1,7-bisphosphate phosphatase